jgi:DNA-binding FadR family transcriptional regulator
MKATDMNTTEPSIDIATGFVRPNLIEAVAEHLRRHLTREGAHGMLPGERHIASAMDVSRPIVREALSILEKEGLILRRHGRSTRLTAKADAAA